MSSKKLTFVVVLVLLATLMLSACAPAAKPASEEAAVPSNGTANSDAINLTGDATNGKVVFEANCAACHGAEGKGGVANSGSDDGTVPGLNPMDNTIANADAKIFAKNVDMFINNGSTPAGSGPALKMPAFGKDKTLSSQDIADVIAYVISLNKK